MAVSNGGRKPTEREHSRHGELDITPSSLKGGPSSNDSRLRGLKVHSNEAGVAGGSNAADELEMDSREEHIAMSDPAQHLASLDTREHGPEPSAEEIWRKGSMQTLTPPPTGPASPPPESSTTAIPIPSSLPLTISNNSKRSRQDPDDDDAYDHDRYRIDRPTFDKPMVDKMTMLINQHFNHDIMNKHQELAEIEKELAKTTACLEQLRRCTLIPFPNEPLDLINTTGPQLRPANGSIVPTYAPAWGVVDGPYTRHWNQWLLPDPSFDGERVGVEQTMASGRSVRGSAQKQWAKSVAKKGCYMRYEGNWVKLVCNVCSREDFSTAQGFINHCRIAHGHEYPSHSAAAQACGVIVSDEEAEEVARQKALSTGSLSHVTRQTSGGYLDTPLQLPSVPTPARKPSKAGMKPRSMKKGGSKREDGRKFEAPLTPPAESGPPKPSICFLKDFMQRAGIAVDEVDQMAHDVLNKTNAIIEDSSSDEEDDNGTLVGKDGARHVKKDAEAAPATKPKPKQRAGARTTTSTPIPKQLTIKLKVNTRKLDLDHSSMTVKRERNSADVEDYLPGPSTAKKNIELIPRTPSMEMDDMKVDVKTPDRKMAADEMPSPQYEPLSPLAEQEADEYLTAKAFKIEPEGGGFRDGLRTLLPKLETNADRQAMPPPPLLPE